MSGRLSHLRFRARRRVLSLRIAFIDGSPLRLNGGGSTGNRRAFRATPTPLGPNYPTAPGFDKAARRRKPWFGLEPGLKPGGRTNCRDDDCDDRDHAIPSLVVILHDPGSPLGAATGSRGACGLEAQETVAIRRHSSPGLHGPTSGLPGLPLRPASRGRQHDYSGSPPSYGAVTLRK